MKNKKLYIPMLISLIFTFRYCPDIKSETIVYQDIIDEITNNQKETVYNIDLNAPFSKSTSGVNETINPETGALSVVYDMFSVKGYANSESINISIEYNSGLSNAQAEGVEVDSSGNYKNALRDKTEAEQSMFSFGTGWRLYLPYVEVCDSNNKTVTYAHMPDGAVYKYNSEEETGLTDYLLSNVVFRTTNLTRNGNTVSYMLSYVNGDCYYFDSEGYLVEKTNNFNAVYYTRDSEKRLTTVSDNSGNVINIEYSDLQIQIKYSDRVYTINRKTQDKATLIESITDPEGRVTWFDYNETEMNYTFFSDIAKSVNKYYLLNSVYYPTGIRTQYLYTKGTKWLYEDESGYIEYPKIESRYDTDGNKSESEVKYEYYLEPDGYPLYKSENLPVSYEYTAAEISRENRKTVYTYNSYHDQTKITVSVGDRLFSEEIREIDSLTRMPKLFISNTYNESGICNTVYAETRFDKRGNTVYTDTYTDTDDKGKNVSEYRYSDGRNACIYESYMKDSNSKTEIVRKLNSLGVLPSEETIYHNGRKIKTDVFEYDDYNNLVYRKTQTDTADFITEKYIYSTKTSNRFPDKSTVSGITNADGEKEGYTVLYEYDKFGNVLKQTNPDGFEVKYTYDKTDRLLSQINEDNTKKKYSYNDTENIIEEISENGLKLLYFYDKYGRIKEVKDKTADIALLSRSYDNYGRLLSETNSLGTSVRYTYDALDRYTSVTARDEKERILTEKYLSYDEAFETFEGKRLKLTLTDGNILSQRQTEYQFDYRQLLMQKTQKGTEYDRITRYEYDNAGNVLNEIAPSGEVTSFEYDCFGNPITAYNPDGTEERYTYDFSGNCTSVTNAEGETVYNMYDGLGRHTASRIKVGKVMNEFKTYYDFRGNAVKSIDAEGNKTVYEYTPRGILANTKQYDTAVTGIETSYEYDLGGYMTKMSYGGIGERERRIYTYDVDLYGRILRETDNAGNKSSYEYDSEGNLLKHTDRNGNVTKYTYDGLSRVTAEENNGETVRMQYNVFGETTLKANSTETEQLSYNQFGELIKRITNTGTQTYEYDINGNILKNTITDKDTDDIVTQYSYDKMNRISEIQTAIGTEYISYDKAGRISEKENSAAGILKQYTYYTDGNIKDIFTIQDGKRIYTENYEYDRNGNKIYENHNDRITEYAYDGMQRLVSEVSGNRRTEYEFDGFNNISKKYELDGLRIDKTSYYYDENNRLLLKSSDNTTEQYEYDKAGNMLQKKSGIGADIVTEYYRYDGYNRLKEYIGIRDYAEYSYNINGLRDSKTVNGKTTRFVYDEGNIASEITEDDYYIYYRGTELMGYTSHSGDRRYYRQDAHGNVTGLLSPDGAEEKEYSYNAYGEKETFAFNPMGDGTIIYQWKAEAEQLHNPFGYCGEYTDSETGLVYLRNRYYAPTTGRFITEDPIKDGLNWYVYCGNNPVMFVDPWGTEYIVVSGSENNTIFDRRFKYNFIEPAIKKLKELKDLNDGETITWLISSTAYSSKDIENFKATSEKNDVNIKFFNNKEQFIRYINTKGIVGTTEFRDSDKIHKIAVFAHGLVGSIEFGYHQRNQSSLSITSKEISLLRMAAFENPNSCFYSCNTGTSDDNGVSFAQSWVNMTGGKTWAIYEKSDYANINNLDNWKTIIKPDRKELGYRPNGSDYYPVPSSSRNAYWKTFSNSVFVQ